MKKLAFLSLAATAASVLAAADFTVSNLSFHQDESTRDVTVVYTLDDGGLNREALVSFDVKTNGVSIGARRLMNVSGDIGRVRAGGTRTFTWRARAGWPGQTSPLARLEVTARPTIAPNAPCGDLAAARANLSVAFEFEDPSNPAKVDSVMRCANHAAVAGGTVRIVDDPERGRVAYFDGAGGYIIGQDGVWKSLSGMMQAAQPFTLAFWIKPTEAQKNWIFYLGTTTDDKGNVSRPHYTSFGMRLMVQSQDGRDAFRMTDSQAYNADTTAGSFTPDVWQHVAITFDGATLRIYVNGTSSYSSAQPLNINRREFAIGIRSTGDLRYKGYMDDFFIFSSCLDSTAVSALAGTAP